MHLELSFGIIQPNVVAKKEETKCCIRQTVAVDQLTNCRFQEVSFNQLSSTFPIYASNE